MLVLVSFVLVLAAAVTLVVGLLQSGLTLIYLSIACSVLAGVVLAVAVLRGRPEPRPAAAPRSFTPPARTQQVPASVGAPTSSAEATSWTAPTPPPPPSAGPSPGPSDDPATKAASTALLGRLRGRRSQQDRVEETPEPAVVPAREPEEVPTDETVEMPAAAGLAQDDGFPIADYDRLRATELLTRLPELDRNQLEAVREREVSGKNRFTVLSRIDSLLAAHEEPAWEAPEEEWEAGADAESEAAVIEAEAVRVEEEFAVAADEEELRTVGEVEDDEVDELVSPAGDFPIAGYDSLTVGQILPRLSDLDADQLAQVRAREQEGRARGTILDRIDRLAARSGTGAGAMAVPAAARKAPARKAPARKASAPAAKKRGRPTSPAAVAPPEAEPIPVPAATPAPKKAAGRRSAVSKKATPAKKAGSARKASARKSTAPVLPEETAAPAKKARAPRKSTKKA